MENIEDDEEELRKKNLETYLQIVDLVNEMVSNSDTEIVFRNFLVGKLKEAAYAFYKDMMHNMESDGYKLLEEVMVDCASMISDSIHFTIWDNQINDDYYLKTYRHALSEAPKYGLDLKDITLEDDEDA